MGWERPTAPGPACKARFLGLADLHGSPCASRCLWDSFPVVAVDTKADGEASATWVRVAVFGDTVGTVAPGLPRAPRVYCDERCLSLGTWIGRDGEARAELDLAAWEVQP